MMIKWKTKYVNHIGKEEYPIYLIVDTTNDIVSYNLECELEIYAMAWYDIYEESVSEYLNEKSKG